MPVAMIFSSTVIHKNISLLITYCVFLGNLCDGLASESPVGCPQHRFIGCINEWRVNVSLPPTDKPSTLDRTLFALLWRQSDDDDGRFRQLCRATTALVDCVGGWRTLDVCYSVGNLMRMQQTRQDATYYVQIHRQLWLQCGVGFQEIVAQFNCLKSVNGKMETTLRKAAETFLASPAGQVCEASFDYLNKTSSYFLPCSQGAVYLQCRISNILANLHAPRCNMQCNSDGPVSPHTWN